jgi:hypothetical protein
MMAKYIIHKTKNYTIMSNYHLMDDELTLKAKGLLSLMLSLPENWDYSVRGLEKICKETKNTINSVLNELEEHNYLKRQRIYFNGKISDWEYHIYERSDLCPKNQDIAFQDIENWDINKYTKELITKELKKDISKDISKERKKFIPPTLEEIQTYCKSRNNNVDPQKFFDYFNESGWIDSKGNSVKNWKQKIITWESNNNTNKKSTNEVNYNLKQVGKNAFQL